MRRTDASLAAMAFLAASVQGTALTLSTVEMITSYAVPLSCIFAYNTPISGCETSDFTSGRCSQGCQRGLLRVQTNIQASCTTVDPQPNSLIWEAQKENLVNALCNREPPQQGTTRTQSPTPSTTSALSITVTVPVSSTTSSKTPSFTQTMSSSTTTTAPTTTPTTTLTTTSTTLLTVSSTSTEPSSTDNTDLSTETGSISTTSTAPQETTTGTESPTSSSSSTTATKTAKPTRDPELGAGDPFANFPNSSGRLGLCVCNMLLTFVVTGLM
ncbi:hypothetical protein BB8028_0001g02210 [Beauveria bassiana]|uniref:Uncharacterized protein n=1 Tax=Beauveria bassiana TaxID=176275 RepID=A0A2S7XWY2_BEABA|nr:hypothetical protein BB8028_0001g02210 [Beauveria bassiana]